MSKAEKVLTAILIALVLVVEFFCITPVGVALRNSYGFAVQKVDDATRYETQKKVEDTCRAMIANYEADRIPTDDDLAVGFAGLPKVDL